mmetsp:Transcript_58835/g.140297  ORF Transcript_58835/g.140297 Transcript_58835/m.140297 type:complete len:755 (+) Transcript_58835:36-2300(+)
MEMISGVAEAARGTSFDAASIAALLRHTEANLAQLQPEDPRPHLSNLAGSRPGWLQTPAAAVDEPPLPPRRSAGPVAEALPRRPPLEDLELEAQIVQLRFALEGLERRVEGELRAFLAVCDKRLQAKEEQLRGVGAGLQVTADGIADGLTKRVESQLRELDRVSHNKVDKSLDELWQSVRRLQVESTSMQDKLHRFAGADDVGEHMAEVSKSLQQHLDEKLHAFERRAVEHREALEGSSEAWREAMNQRCRSLESQIWDWQAQRGDVTDALMKRLPEAAPLRELKEELQKHSYEVDVQSKRLFTCEARLSKLQSLEAKVEFAEAQTANQVEEHAQRAQAVEDFVQRLAQRAATTEALAQRAEARTATLDERMQDVERRFTQLANSTEASTNKWETQCRTLEAKFCIKNEEDTQRAQRSLEAVQEKLLLRVTDFEAKYQRHSAEVAAQQDVKLRDVRFICDKLNQAVLQQQDERKAAAARLDAELLALGQKIVAGERDLSELQGRCKQEQLRVDKLHDDARRTADRLNSFNDDLHKVRSTLEELQGTLGDLEVLCHTTAEAAEEDMQRRANTLHTLSMRAQSLHESAAHLRSGLALDSSWHEEEPSWVMAEEPAGAALEVQTYRFTFEAVDPERLLGIGRGEMLQLVHELLQEMGIGTSDVEAIGLGSVESVEVQGAAELRIMLRNGSLSTYQQDQILALCRSLGAGVAPSFSMQGLPEVHAVPAANLRDEHPADESSFMDHSREGAAVMQGPHA